MQAEHNVFVHTVGTVCVCGFLNGYQCNPGSQGEQDLLLEEWHLLSLFTLTFIAAAQLWSLL